MKKRLLSILLALCMVLAILPGTAHGAEVASGTCGDNLTWTLNDAGILTISGTGEMYAYYSYNSGRSPWYSKWSNIKEIIIEEGVESIGNYAFYECYNVKSISISDSVTNIGNGAFSYCERLENLMIPNNVAYIGSDVFLSCYKLTDIKVDSNNQYFSSREGILFDKKMTRLICYPSAKQGNSYSIPDGIISIDNNAFYASDLTNLTIPDSVIYIGEGAFRASGTLSNVVIGSGITTISKYMFDSCSKLTNIIIPNGVTTVAERAFYGSGLTKVIIPTSVTNIGYEVFYCKNLTDVYYQGNISQWNSVKIDNINKGNKYLLEATIHYNSTGPDEDIQSSSNQISDEMILRARILTKSHTFSFYRDWETPVQITAQMMDPLPAAAWYVIENLLDMYYKAVMNGDDSVAGIGKVTSVEFYEYLLIKLLDGKEMKYLSVTEPFAFIDDISGDTVDTALLKKLVKGGFKAGTKITNNDKSKIKEICTAMCGTDSVSDVGWLDAILVSGKTIDEFASEFVALYRLTTVSDARTEAIRMIGEKANDTALRTATRNVCTSIQRAKEDGIEYCLSGGLEESMDYISTWTLDKMVDALCKIHPASKIWKATADATIFAMDTIFLTDDVSTDTLYILSMANVERAILLAIDQAEQSFISQKSFENAQRLVALAECYQQELLVGCDLVENLVNHSERSNLNWNGILDLLSMVQEKKLDFRAALKFLFGDSNSSYAHLRETLQQISKTIEETDFYSGTDILSVIREVRSTTPSDWAADEIQKAINYNLLLTEMQNNYQENITRVEFCILLECMLEEKSDKAIDVLIEERGTPIHPTFDDALYIDVDTIARLGIINGVGDNKFNPLGEITRQEAATMLYRTAKVLGYDTSATPTNFSGVASWASQGVDFVVANGIMFGTGNGFEPEGKYTKEQAILTMVRFYENIA